MDVEFGEKPEKFVCPKCVADFERGSIISFIGSTKLTFHEAYSKLSLWGKLKLRISALFSPAGTVTKAFEVYQDKLIEELRKRK